MSQTHTEQLEEILLSLSKLKEGDWIWLKTEAPLKKRAVRFVGIYKLFYYSSFCYLEMNDTGQMIEGRADARDYDSPMTAEDKTRLAASHTAKAFALTFC